MSFMRQFCCVFVYGFVEISRVLIEFCFVQSVLDLPFNEFLLEMFGMKVKICMCTHAKHPFILGS